MSDERELYPCPFCGSGDLKMVGPQAPATGIYPKLRYVHCQSCGTCGPPLLPAEAVSAWNQRDLELAAHMIETRRQALRSLPEELGDPVAGTESPQTE